MDQKRLVAFFAVGCLGLGALGACGTAAALLFMASSSPSAVGAGQPGAAPPTATADGGTKRRPGRARGRVTGPDGRPIHVPGSHVDIMIQGLTAAAENAGVSPRVGADGTYDVALPPGNYQVWGYVRLTFEGQSYRLPLDPLEDQSVSQDSTAGVVMDFVWKLTGKKPNATAEPSNWANYYGATVSLVFGGWRDDMKKAVGKPPQGTKAVFTLVPRGPLVDGTAGKTLTFEREYDKLLGGLAENNLSDIPLGSYTLTGFEAWPDGSRHELVFEKSYAVYADSLDVSWKPWSGSEVAGPANVNFTRKVP